MLVGLLPTSIVRVAEAFARRLSVTVSTTLTLPWELNVNFTAAASAGSVIRTIVPPKFHSHSTIEPSGSGSDERSMNSTSSPAWKAGSTALPMRHEKSGTGGVLSSMTRMVFSQDICTDPRWVVIVCRITNSPPSST